MPQTVGCQPPLNEKEEGDEERHPVRTSRTLVWMECDATAPCVKCRGVETPAIFLRLQQDTLCLGSVIEIAPTVYGSRFLFFQTSLATSFDKFNFVIQASKLPTNRTHAPCLCVPLQSFFADIPAPDRCLCKLSHKWKWCLARRTSSYPKRWGCCADPA